jgi:hypothetical protein
VDQRPPACLAGLKTVVKHEAFALRRHRERQSPITDDGELGERPTPPGITHDQAALYERLRHGAEALERLKPQEAQLGPTPSPRPCKPLGERF